MKTYDQLTLAEQRQAEAQALDSLLQAIIEGAIRFNDKANDDDLQARIDKAGKQADEMRTPWFVGEYIMDTCRPELEGMAQVDAQDALYPDPTEHVIRLRAA